MNTLTVKQLNLFVKSLIEGDVRLADITVTGEISNFKNHYASGHLYFTLKDNDAAIKCVMFRTNAGRVKFSVSDGMKVMLRGRVSLYEKDGQYQFYAEEMHEVGVGDIALQFEQTKQKLEKEGLFADENKRPLPKFPQKIAVITSDTGAAVQDILNITERRWPLAQIVLCPVSVQGENAVPSMLNALERVYNLGICDVIIIGRGGGSIEDLYCFNSEALARKIYESPIPVISAVGHETDFTICDFVADLRAPTPSAAAELAVPDVNDVYNSLNKYVNVLFNTLQSKYRLNTLRLDALLNKDVLHNPQVLLERKREFLDIKTEKLITVFSSKFNDSRNRLQNDIAKLDVLSPLKILSRGYAVVTSENKTVKSANELQIGDKISVTLSNGKLLCTVDDKEK